MEPELHTLQTPQPVAAKLTNFCKATRTLRRTHQCFAGFSLVVHLNLLFMLLVAAVFPMGRLIDMRMHFHALAEVLTDIAWVACLYKLAAYSCARTQCGYSAGLLSLRLLLLVTQMIAFGRYSTEEPNTDRVLQPWGPIGDWCFVICVIGVFLILFKTCFSFPLVDEHVAQQPRPILKETHLRPTRRIRVPRRYSQSPTRLDTPSRSSTMRVIPLVHETQNGNVIEPPCRPHECINGADDNGEILDPEKVD